MLTESLGNNSVILAFEDIVTFVDSLMIAGIDLNSVHQAPEFSYIMTPKQMERITKLCLARGWDTPLNRGVHISMKTVHHVIDSRKSKDGLNNSEIASILSGAFNKSSEVEINRDYSEQVIIFNAKKVLLFNGQRYHAVAIVQANKNGNQTIDPVTAYHAQPNKIRGIKNN